MRPLFDRIIKPSTRAFIREAWKTPGFGLLDYIHGYIYGRWPYEYIGTGLSRKTRYKLLRPVGGLMYLLGMFGSKKKNMGFADTYHGKAVPTKTAERILTLNREVNTELPEQVIPYKTARDIVLKNPDHIVLLECPCRSVRENPCLPLDVCLVVGEPFASFLIEHRPEKARWATQQEAVQVLRDARDRGHVHHVFFKEAMLDRFYAVCNCCSCCCGAMQAQRSGIKMLCSSGYLAQPDPELCAGCGICVKKCQFRALWIKDGTVRVKPRRCMGCGVCEAACPEDAIKLILAPEKGAPLEI